jgi:aminopeptidase YwaD
MAHHDTKIDTPGAIDNGTGVVILLELMDHFQRNPPPIGLEFIVFGGEEYLPIGDDEYIRRAGEAYLNKVKYAINFDGCAHKLGSDSLACIAGSVDFSAQVDKIRTQQGRILASDPWPESNHSTFTFRGVPALAYTSHSARKYVHQMDDSLRWVDEAKMEEIVALTIRIITTTCSQPIDWFRAASPSGQ